MTCRFMDSNGNGWVSDAIRCFEYCLSKDAHVMSNSWGGVDYSKSLQVGPALAPSAEPHCCGFHLRRHLSGAADGALCGADGHRPCGCARIAARGVCGQRRREYGHHAALPLLAARRGHHGGRRVHQHQPSLVRLAALPPCVRAGRVATADTVLMLRSLCAGAAATTARRRCTSRRRACRCCQPAWAACTSRSPARPWPRRTWPARPPSCWPSARLRWSQLLVNGASARGAPDMLCACA